MAEQATKALILEAIRGSKDGITRQELQDRFDGARQVLGDLHGVQAVYERRGAVYYPENLPKKTPLEWVAELREYDHCFLTVEGVKTFSEAFGVPLTPTYHRAQPDKPKGLTMDDGSEGAVDMSAHQIAETIAAKICGWKPWQMGRGFRLRSACDALEKHFKENAD